jgi:hypothetical protein
LVYYTLLPKYLQWSRDFALDMNECELRTKDWVEILPKFPDIDAISEKFFAFKGRNKAVKMFNAKSGIDLSLVIQHEKYEAILSHLQDLEESNAVCSYYIWCSEMFVLTQNNFLQLDRVTSSSDTLDGTKGPAGTASGRKSKRKAKDAELQMVHINIL